MKKEILFLIAIIIVAIGYAGFNQYEQTKAPITQAKKVNVEKTASNQSSPPSATQSTEAVPKNDPTRATLSVDDPLLSCSDNHDVCEKSILSSLATFGYSDYIWVNAGDTVTFGGETQGTDPFSIWIESEDGSFSSDVHDVQGKGQETYTFEAPFDGNFRVVVQHDKQASPVTAYIKDPWPE